MTHATRRDELLDLALGLLEPAEATALETHAAGCPACRAELASLRQTRQLVAGLPSVEAPARGEGILLAAARQAADLATAGRSPRWAAPRWLWGGALGLAGAAALAVLVLQPGLEPRQPGTADGDAVAARPAERPVDRLAAREEVAPPAPAPVGSPAPTPERKTGTVAATTKSAAEAPAAPAVLASPEPSRAKAEMPAPAARMAASWAVRGDAAGGPCRLEQRRLLTSDDAGRVIGRRREGRYPAAGGEVLLTVVERYGPDGRLLGAELRAGDRLLTVGPAEIEAGRLEPLPGVVLAGSAQEAVSAPPRCEP